VRGPGAIAGTGRAQAAAWMGAACGDFSSALSLRAERKQVRATVATVRRFLWAAAIIEPSRLTIGSVQQYLSRLLAAGRSPKTLANHRSAISSFCDFLHDRGELPVNPCGSVRLRKPEERLPRYLSEDEAVEVLRLAAMCGIWPEVALALHTGLRLGELIRLQWADIDLTRRILAVRKSKSGRPRILPLSREALAALEAQQAVSGALSNVFPARQTWWSGWRFIDHPRASNWWRRALKPIQDAMPIFRQGMAATATGRGWHLFRHTFASRAAQRGVSLYKLAAWLGHSDVRTTAIYAHLQGGYDPDIERA